MGFAIFSVVVLALSGVFLILSIKYRQNAAAMLKEAEEFFNNASMKYQSIMEANDSMMRFYRKVEALVTFAVDKVVKEKPNG